MEPKVPITFQGNNYDLIAVASVICAVGVLMSCIPGFYCILPFLSGVLGVIGLMTVDEAVDVDRSEILWWIALATSYFGIALYTFVMFILILLTPIPWYFISFALGCGSHC